MIKMIMMTTTMLFISSGIVSAQSDRADIDYAPSATPAAQKVGAVLPIDPAGINVVSGNLGD